MKSKIQFFIFVISFMLSTYCFAMFCPNSFKQINIGDTQKQIEAMCGKPILIENQENEDSIPQEWTYYMQIPNYGMPPSINNNQGTMKVTFAFIDGKTTNMTSNGIGVGATTICKNINLQIDSTTDDVRNACGKPAIITKTNIEGANISTQPTKISKWTYDSNPKVTFTFENGVLKERN